MALLGAASLIQIVFLPGYLLLKAVGLRAGLLRTCVLSFALSLVVNHVLVAAMVVAGIYRPATVYFVFCAELAVFCHLSRKWWKVEAGNAFAAGKMRVQVFFRAVDGSSDPGLGRRIVLIRRALTAAAVALIAAFGVVGIAQFGQVFQQWDAVVSWNRWAIDWAGNRLPYATSLYPQLLPTNLSLTYVFQQSSEIWLFAKGFQFLFCLMLLLAIVDLARTTEGFGCVLGVLITYGLLVATLRFRMLASGYADVPLAFLSFAAIHAILAARGDADSRNRWRYLLLGAFLAAGAASTKQNGLYLAALYPCLAWMLVLGARPASLPSPSERGAGGEGRPTKWSMLRQSALTLTLSRRERGHDSRPPARPKPSVRDSIARKVMPLLGITTLIVALVVPWYLYKFLDIRAGNDANNTALLATDFHEGRGIPQRMVHASAMFIEATTPVGAIVLLVALAAALANPVQRWLVLLLVVPFGLIWASTFSYDLRNLAMIIPFVGIAAGSGLVQIAARLYRNSMPAPGLPNRQVLGVEQVAPPSPFIITPAQKSRTARGPSSFRCSTTWSPSQVSLRQIAMLLTVCVAGVAFIVPDRWLRDLQQRQQRNVGITELNRHIYGYAETSGIRGVLATDYQALRWLPEIGPKCTRCTCHELSAFRTTYDRQEVRTVLVALKSAAPSVLDFLDGQCRAAAARQVFENHGYRFYELRR